MASAGKRRGAGERVLESRHVIGLFLLMLVFSGVFFTLGFVMGRNQYDGQVRASTNTRGFGNAVTSSKSDATSKRASNSPSPEPLADSSGAANSDWEFYNAGKPKQTEDHLKSAAPSALPRNASVSPRYDHSGKNAQLIPSAAYTVQVAALRKEADALDLASRLQKKKFPAFVLSPQGDKYFRVQVGPYADQKAADAARKGLESAGFKALVKRG